MMETRAGRALALVLATAVMAACAPPRPTDTTIARNRQALEYLERVTGDMAYMGASEADVHKCKIELTTAGTLIDEKKYDDALARLDVGLACANEISIGLRRQLEEIRANPKIDLRTFLGRDVDWGKGPYRIIGIESQTLPNGTHFAIHFESKSGLQKTVEFLLQ